MADWLSVTERGAVQPIVTRYVGGFGRTILSAPFGALMASSTGGDQSLTNSSANCALQTDDGTIYAVLYDGLYKSTDSGATFPTQVMAFTVPTNDLDRRLQHGGLHIAYDAGNQELILGGWFAPTTSFRLTGWTYRLSDGATSETDQAFAGSTDRYFGSEILYGTAVHFPYGDGNFMNNLFSFDLVSQGWTNFTKPVVAGFTNCASCCYAVGSDGALYLASEGIVSGINYATALWKFTGAWVQLGFVVGPLNDNTFEGGRAQRRIALFSDGLDLHCVTGISNGTTIRGWRHYTITAASGFDPTMAVDRTIANGAIVPDDLRIDTDNAGTANANATKRCIVVQDTESIPGTLQTFLAFADDSQPGTQYSVHKYMGIAAPYDFVGVGGQVRDSLPQASRNGGAYFYTPGQLGIRILAVTPVVGGERIDYLVSGGGTVAVQFRHAPNQQGATALATLAGPVTGGGSLNPPNQVTGVLANGTTVHTVVWNFFGDGFDDGQALVALVPETV